MTNYCSVSLRHVLAAKLLVAVPYFYVHNPKRTISMKHNALRHNAPGMTTLLADERLSRASPRSWQIRDIPHSSIFSAWVVSWCGYMAFGGYYPSALCILSGDPPPKGALRWPVDLLVLLQLLLETGDHSNQDGARCTQDSYRFEMTRRLHATPSGALSFLFFTYPWWQ
jgi:hypothetical protein